MTGDTPESTTGDTPESTTGYTPQSTPQSQRSLQVTPTSVYSYHITGTPVKLKQSSSSPFPLSQSASSKSRSSETRSLSDSALSTPEVLEEINKVLEEDKISEDEDEEGETTPENQKLPTPDDSTDTKPESNVSQAVTEFLRKKSKETAKQNRANLAHPKKPYALTSSPKKGKTTIFEALHYEEDSHKDELLTHQGRYSPEGKC
jgi:hypothetical protein